jgi:hypothetical protein
MNKGEKKSPVIYFDPRAVLTPEEKSELRILLSSRAYIKLLTVAAGMRPSTAGQGLGSRERDAFSDSRAAHRLSEMRGWDLYQLAIFSVLQDKPLPRALVPDSFPDEGTFQHQITHREEKK